MPGPLHGKKPAALQDPVRRCPGAPERPLRDEKTAALQATAWGTDMPMRMKRTTIPAMALP